MEPTAAARQRPIDDKMWELMEVLGLPDDEDLHERLKAAVIEVITRTAPTDRDVEACIAADPKAFATGTVHSVSGTVSINSGTQPATRTGTVAI